MNPDNKEVQAPNFEGEKMKMPENSSFGSKATEETATVVNSPILLILTVLLVIILGGMYYWFHTMTTQVAVPTPVVDRPTAEENNEPESTTAEAQTEMMQAVSTSDEITAIESDLEATNVDSLDAELQAIEAEMEADISSN